MLSFLLAVCGPLFGFYFLMCLFSTDISFDLDLLGALGDVLWGIGMIFVLALWSLFLAAVYRKAAPEAHPRSFLILTTLEGVAGGLLAAAVAISGDGSLLLPLTVSLAVYAALGLLLLSREEKEVRKTRREEKKAQEKTQEQVCREAAAAQAVLRKERDGEPSAFGRLWKACAPVSRVLGLVWGLGATGCLVLEDFPTLLFSAVLLLLPAFLVECGRRPQLKQAKSRLLRAFAYASRLSRVLFWLWAVIVAAEAANAEVKPFPYVLATLLFLLPATLIERRRNPALSWDVFKKRGHRLPYR